MKEGTSTFDSSVAVPPSVGGIVKLTCFLAPSLGLPRGLGPALDEAELTLPAGTS